MPPTPFGLTFAGGGGGIIVGFGGTSTVGSEYIVQGNTISNLNSGSGIQIGDGRNIVISGNILRNWGTGDGININSSLATGIQNLTITGNILDTNTNSAGSGNGIVCSPGVGGVKNVTIGSNQISSIAFHGIKINACLDGTITGNQIFNFNLQAASANGIDLESGATAWTIGNNRARSTAANGFAIGINTGAVDNIVSGNIDLNAAGAFYDNGTRTIIFGEKVNASDKNFQLNSPGAGIGLNGSTSGVVTHVAGSVITSYTETDPLAVPIVAGAVKTYTTGAVASFSAAPGSLTIASGTSTLTSNAALAAVTSQAAITTTATNALTTDAIEWSFATAPTAGDNLCHVLSYVTAGNVNFVRTNPTAAAQNVSALIINWRVVR